MEIDLTQIIVAFLTLIFGLIAKYLIPYIKEKYSSEQLNEIKKWIKIAVQAAEMIYSGSGMGKTKKQYVLDYVFDFLKEKGFTIDTETVNNLIESAVLEMNIEKAKT